MLRIYYDTWVAENVAYVNLNFVVCTHFSYGISHTSINLTYILFTKTVKYTAHCANKSYSFKIYNQG